MIPGRKIPAGTDIPYVTIVIEYHTIAKIIKSLPIKNIPLVEKSNLMHSTSVL